VAGRRWGRLAALVLGAAVLAGAGWALFGALATAPAPSTVESTDAVRAYAINRFGFGAAHLPGWGRGFAALQVAGYQTLTDAVDRTGSALAAGREAMAVAALLTAAALGVAAHRLRMSVPAVVAVIGLSSLAPATVLMHRVVEPVNLGVFWACAALVFAAPRATGTARAALPIGSCCCLGLGLATAPVVSIAVVPVLTALVCSGDVGRLGRPGRWIAGVVGTAGWGVLVWLVAAGRLAVRPVGVAVPGLTTVDSALCVGAVLAGLAALRVRWLRSLAVGLLGTAAVAAAVPAARPVLVLVAIPLAALVAPGLADTVALAAAGRGRAAGSTSGGPAGGSAGERAGGSAGERAGGSAGERAGRVGADGRGAEARVRARVPAGRRVAVVVPVVATVLVLAGAAALARTSGRDGTGAAGDAATSRARDWVLTNLPSRPRLAVDDPVWFALVRAGYPADKLAAVGAIGPAGAGPVEFVACRMAALAGAGASVNPVVRAAWTHAVPVARFGSGVDLVEVRRVVAGTADPDRSAGAATARTEAGGALLRNGNLRLSPGAATVLRRGGVDGRLLALLATLAADHALAVPDFPVVDGEDPAAPRRLVTITAVDGTPVRPGSAAVADLERFMTAQQPPYRPAAVTPVAVAGAAALQVRFDAVPAPEILPG
jgi:hypothetical protein